MCPIIIRRLSVIVEVSVVDYAASDRCYLICEEVQVGPVFLDLATKLHVGSTAAAEGGCTLLPTWSYGVSNRSE